MRFLTGRTALAAAVICVGVAGYLLSPETADAPAAAVAGPNVFDPDTGVIRVLDVSELADSVLVEDDVPILVRDGTRLSAKVFRPNTNDRHPVVMAFTAYDKDGGMSAYPAVLNVADNPNFDFGSFEISPWTAWEAPDPAYWTQHGYAVVYVDTRGYGASEGDAHVLSARDGEDFYDAIEWAGAQPWSNGNVGLNGVSYLAISQWVAASGNPPSLKAMIPWEGQSDNFREVLFHGGIPETAFSAFWLNRIATLAHKRPVPPDFAVKLGQRYPLLMKRLQSALQPPSGIRLADIQVPALICATWSDQGLHTRGSFEGFKQVASSQKWLFTHGRPKWETYYSAEALSTQLAFFDHFLKGIENGFDQRPAVRLEVREGLRDYAVRYVKDWPVPETQYQALYLDAENGVLSQNTISAPAMDSYDPRTDRSEFVFEFDRDTELSGNMKLKLWVSTDRGNDMDLFIGVEKLDRAGQPVHFFAKTGYTQGPVAMGWLRVSHRELDPRRSTPAQPVLAHERSLKLDRNEVVPVEIEILPSSTLFRSGESLRLIVQGRDLFDHPMLAHKRTVNEGTHVLHTGGTYDAHLLIPITGTGF
ncbi:MAG: CocE/NonD family hydrolase [Pseudomonadota bacterium]